MARLTPNESSYIVIVTRGHRDDMRVLRWAVQTQAQYVGMIGSKRKTIAIFRELTQEGLRRQLFERVHAPIGLDIGAVTSGGNCGGHHGRIDCRAAQCGARTAAHELVSRQEFKRCRNLSEILPAKRCPEESSILTRAAIFRGYREFLAFCYLPCMGRAPSLCGVILAAGESTRMGTDKALLPWPPAESRPECLPAKPFFPPRLQALESRSTIW